MVFYFELTTLCLGGVCAGKPEDIVRGPEAELQAVVSYPTCVLGTRLRSSAGTRELSAVNHCSISAALRI